jgi:hypothetical protein
MQRRKFSREFKIEAVKLVRERGVSAAQAGRDLSVHENVLRKASSSTDGPRKAATSLEPFRGWTLPIPRGSNQPQRLALGMLRAGLSSYIPGKLGETEGHL